MPSCSSRSSRRRAASASSTMRRRDASSRRSVCSRATALAASSARSPIRCSLPSGNGASRELVPASAPQISPATTIGAATEDRTSIARIITGSSPASPS